MVAQPAAAAEPHDLHRTDEFTVLDREDQDPRTCTIEGRNTLLENGDAFVHAISSGDVLCTDFSTVQVEVSYVDTAGTTVRFTVFGEGGSVRASLTDVDSDLVIRYQADFPSGWGTAPTYSLPK